MRKLLLLLALLALPCPAEAQDTRTTPSWCNKTFSVNQGAVALTKVISGVANQSIQLCGVSASGGAAASTLSLSYGTGTNCATGTVTIFPIVNLAINGAYIDHVPFANVGVPSVNSSGVANDVCLVTTGTGPITVILYYAQF